MKQPKTSPQLKIERLAVSALTLDPQNARLHPERNLAAI